MYGVPLAYKNTYGVDGIMIGRAAIGYPWIFREIKHFMATGEMLPPPTIEERIDICRRHLTRSVEWKGEKLGVLEMRRHYAAYLRGLSHVKEYRMQLVNALSMQEVLEILAHLQENQLSMV